ncbi:MAG: LysM peptidoglycan-binding domain-containing protein [Pirellulales bacterium]
MDRHRTLFGRGLSVQTSRPLAAFLVMAIGTLAAMPFRRNNLSEPVPPAANAPTAEIDLTTAFSPPTSRWNFEPVSPEETSSPAVIPPVAELDMVPLVPVSTTIPTTTKKPNADSAEAKTIRPPTLTTVPKLPSGNDGRTLPPDLPRRFEFPLASLKTSSASEGDSSDEPIADFKTHQIRKGDTLEKIALDYLGNAGRADEIFEINRGILVSPDLLPLGKILKIPQVDERAKMRVAVPPLAPFPEPESGPGIHEPSTESGGVMVPLQDSGSSMPLTEL